MDMKATRSTLDEAMVDNADNTSGVIFMPLESGSKLAWFKMVSTPGKTGAIVSRTNKLHFFQAVGQSIGAVGQSIEAVGQSCGIFGRGRCKKRLHLIDRQWIRRG